MGVFQNNLMGAAAAAASAGGADFYDHQIANSARFTGSGVLSRTAGTPTNEDKFTISCWVKRSILGTANNFVFGYTDNINYQKLAFNSTDKLELHEQRGGGDSNGLRTVDQVFRDPGTWYHVVWVFDSGNATEADREIFYVNGTRLTDVEGWDGGYPTQNRDSVFNKSGATIHIGSASSYYGSYFQGYMAEVVFNDGQAYAASDYGETKNGVWIPKDPSGLTFGDNGFYLKFESNSDMGNDSSGNNNDFSESGVDTHDQMLDTPTFNSSSNGGNFATWNPLNAGSYTTLAEGNLKATGTSSGASNPSGTFAMTSGKWYWEMLVVDEVSGYPYPGLTVLGNITNSPTTGGDIWAMRYDITSGSLGANSGANITGLGTITTTSTGVATATDGDIISWYLDCDNRKAWIAKNGSIPNSGDPANGTNPQWSWTATPNNPITFTAQVYNGDDTILNAGQDGTFAGEKTAQGNSDDTGYGNFYYDPPTGFLAMCSGNQPTADAVDPAQTDDNYPQKMFNPVLYTGNGSSQSVTGVGFQPDWTWIKNRNGTQGHKLFDSTRGVTKVLSSHNNDAESTESGLSAFGSDGFSLGGSTVAGYNTSSNTYVAWNWRANGGTTSSNSDGSVTSTVQADPSGAFSIVTWAGSGGAATIGHGLSGAPSFMIAKSRTSSATVEDWVAFHKNMNNGAYPANESRMYLNSTGGYSTGALWQNDNNSSTVFGVTSNISNSSKNYVAYCFTDVEGYCKADYYVGNGNADGVFVYTGFRPALVTTKRTDGSGSWLVHDNARNTSNVTDKILLWNDSGAEFSGSNDKIDMLSNGFKVRSSNAGINGSGNDYIYLAMAHNPFKYATGR